MESSTASPSEQSPQPRSSLAPADRAQGFVRRARPAKRSGRRWIIFLVLLVIVAGFIAWGVRRAIGPGGGALAASAEFVVVTRGTVEKSINSSGKVVSNLDVDIKCRASGEVIKLPFDVSQAVKKGNLLCQLDPTDEQLAVRSAEAALAQSTARLAQARNDVRQAEENLATTRRRDESSFASAKVKAANLAAKAQRQKQLVEQKLGSQEDLETAETDASAAASARDAAQIAIDELKQQEIQIEYKRQAVKGAEAQLQGDQVNLDTQKQQLAYTTVAAPIDGVVSALDVQMGTIVASGMSGFSGGTTIMTLSDLSRIFVTATVDESDIGEVRVGQPARITVASFPSRTFSGKVVRIATKGVNSSNVVTFEVKVEVVDEHKDLLRPEMTGNVTIVQAARTGVLMLPSAAVVRQGDQAFVTTIDGKRKPVTLGLEGSESVEVVEGIAAGDRVAVMSAELPSRWKNQETGPGGGPPPPR